MNSRFYSIPRFGLPYTPADFIAALAATTTGGPSADHFPLFGDRAKFWTRSGRQALRLILEALDLPPGSGVAVPLFTDPSVVMAIAGAGYEPVFIDINERTLTINPKSLWMARGKFSALVIVHLFGHPADIPDLLRVAPGVPVVEDTAHSPLSYLDGRMTGDFGVASFYSFASTKYWPAGGGGLAVINHPALAGKIAPRISALTRTSRTEALHGVLFQAAKTAVFSRPLYGLFGKPLRARVEKYALLEPQLDSLAIQAPHAAVACRQAARLEVRVERHRENSLQLLSHLADLDEIVLPWERPSARYNYHLFPILLRDREERSRVAAAMWENFVDTSTIYYNVVENCRPFGYKSGCPIAESVADRLLTLPNYASLTASDIERVAEVFRSSLQAVRAVRPRKATVSRPSQVSVHTT